MLNFFFVAAAALIFHQGVNAATTHGRPIEYNVIQSANNPNYSVRFVNPNLCDPNVTQVFQVSNFSFLLLCKC